MGLEFSDRRAQTLGDGEGTRLLWFGGLGEEAAEDGGGEAGGCEASYWCHFWFFFLFEVSGIFVVL